MYEIKCWIPVEPEENELYSNYQDVLVGIENMVYMQPKNRYEICCICDSCGSNFSKIPVDGICPFCGQEYDLCL